MPRHRLRTPFLAPDRHHVGEVRVRRTDGGERSQTTRVELVDRPGTLLGLDRVAAEQGVEQYEHHERQQDREEQCDRRAPERQQLRSDLSGDERRWRRPRSGIGHGIAVITRRHSDSSWASVAGEAEEHVLERWPAHRQRLEPDAVFDRPRGDGMHVERRVGGGELDPGAIHGRIRAATPTTCRRPADRRRTTRPCRRGWQSARRVCPRPRAHRSTAPRPDRPVVLPRRGSGWSAAPSCRAGTARRSTPTTGGEQQRRTRWWARRGTASRAGRRCRARDRAGGAGHPTTCRSGRRPCRRDRPDSITSATGRRRRYGDPYNAIASLTVSSVSTPDDCNTTPMRSLNSRPARSGSVPSTETSPLSRVRWPSRISTIVDLPAPLWPSRAYTSPRRSRTTPLAQQGRCRTTCADRRRRSPSPGVTHRRDRQPGVVAEMLGSRQEVAHQLRRRLGI